MPIPPDDSQADEHALCEQAAQGDEAALTSLLDRYRTPLSRMIRVRLPEQLQARVDDSDIMQETCAEAARCISRFEPDPERPFYLWLRQIAWNKLIEAQRNHLATQKRDANRDQPLQGGDPTASSSAVADFLVGSITSPSMAAIRAEMKQLLEQQLAELDDVDREVLVLRHFEQLSTSQTATVLGISKSAAGKRYLNALDRLRSLMMRVAELSQS